VSLVSAAPPAVTSTAGAIVTSAAGIVTAVDGLVAFINNGLINTLRSITSVIGLNAQIQVNNFICNRDDL
jgi:hypothetical protein